MPRAVAPLFVAALLILVVAGVIAGVRLVGDDGVTAVGPGETPTATSPGAEEPDAGEADAVVPSPTASPSPTLATPSPTPTGTATAPDDRAEGQQAQPGATETPTVTVSPTVAPTTTASPTDERTPLALDDMPETGGGAATLLAGFIVLTGAAGLVTRRR